MTFCYQSVGKYIIEEFSFHISVIVQMNIMVFFLIKCSDTAIVRFSKSNKIP